MNGDVALLAVRTITAVVALSIALMALKGYVRFRSWRLFFLATAFLILSMSPLLDTARLLGDYLATSQWTLDALEFASYLFTLCSVAAFFLIAYVYWDERRVQSIIFTRSQAIVGGGLLVIEFLLFLAVAWTPFSEVLRYQFQLPTALYLVFTAVSHFLALFISISLYSYYKAKRTRNTLFAFIGFILILFSQSYGLFGWATEAISLMADYQSSLVATASFELLGYLAFLVGLLRLGRSSK
jgi:hypothetical protein